MKSKDEIAETQKAFRAANRDNRRAKDRIYYEANKVKMRAKQKAYREANKDKESAYYATKRNKGKAKWYGYRNYYPLATRLNYDAYLAATHCECCRVEFDLRAARKCQDHCHDTGKLRGVICNSCNIIEGYAQGTDRLAAVMQYMKLHADYSSESPLSSASSC
jgi:hypothetical protein